MNELSSLTFRLAFADTFGDAINSEVRSSIFVTHNFDGFSLNVAALNDKSFLTINPQTSVSLRNAPEGRFSSVERAPWRDLPVYFGFDAFAGAVASQRWSDRYACGVWARSEFAPRGHGADSFRTVAERDFLRGVSHELISAIPWCREQAPPVRRC